MTDEDVSAEFVQLLVEGAARAWPVTALTRIRRTEVRRFELERPPGLRGQDIGGGARGRFYDRLFRAGDRVPMDGDMQRTNVSTTPALRRQLAYESTAAGWVRRPVTRLLARLLAAISLVLIVLISCTTGSGVTPSSQSDGPYGLPYLLIVPLVLYVLSAVITPYAATPAGKAVERHRQQFSGYLRSGETRRLATPQGARIYSRWLPWAVAAGIDEEWTRTFARAATDLARTDPQALHDWERDLSWYAGPLPCAQLRTPHEGGATAPAAHRPSTWHEHDNGGAPEMSGGAGHVGPRGPSFDAAMTAFAEDVIALLRTVHARVGGATPATD